MKTTPNPNEISIVEVTADNVSELGVFCIKDKKSPGYALKVDWFKSKINSGVKIRIATDKQNKQLGFIEYIPSELAWRPVEATNYLFVQCIVLMVKEARQNGIGSALLRYCEMDARKNNKSGVCAMSSNGVWMANRTLYEKNGYREVDKLGRFELMSLTFDDKFPQPRFIDWTKQQTQYKGWNLVYSDQCPWHQKSTTDLVQAASDYGIELKVKRLSTPQEARNAPSGFGTFSLIKDGKLLEDHYLSRTRFENILKKELGKDSL
jgi:GNAT superfamily N-acetyltransferase